MNADHWASLSWKPAAMLLAAVMIGLAVSACDTLPGGGVLPPGADTPPTGAITQPQVDVFLENGETTSVSYFAQSAEQPATLDVYADRDANPTNGNEVPIQTGINVPAGSAGTAGSLLFNTTGIPNATYRIYGRVSDGVNPPFQFVSSGSVIVAPAGSRPRPEPPTIQVNEPRSNLGLSSQDTVTVIYAYTSPSSPVTVTLLLDRDRDPTNDNINNPGDPADPNVPIIILPSAQRKPTDPTFGADPPPPDDPNNPPTDPDSVQVRTNPRQLGTTVSGLPPTQKTYLFDIDFSRVPPRADGLPWFLRATISDGINPPSHAYAVGSLTIASAAAGTVDLGTVGFQTAGAKFVGFSQGEWLGTEILGVTDIDSDTVDDFMLVSRYGSPRNRPQPGAAYLVFGRRKVPFPPDTDGDGRPDVRDSAGNVVNFPQPPLFIFNPAIAGNVSPYDSRVVGRFGGTISVNSIGALVAGSFYRGTTYTMPKPLTGTQPPATLRDVDHPGLATAGLTSVTRVNLTGLDTVGEQDIPIPDFIFGLPFVSTAREYLDDDPCDKDPPDNNYGDGLPNPISGREANDDLAFNQTRPIDTGLVIVVSGSNDIANQFRQFVDAGIAGQFDQRGAVDDEGIIRGAANTPDGVRLRGSWFSLFETFVLDSTSEFGAQVAALNSLDNDTDPELAISAPGQSGQSGMIYLFQGQDFRADIFHGDSVLSLPSYDQIDCAIPIRGTVTVPAYATIAAATFGDRLGYPAPAGDINQDGTQDVLCGAPGASRDGFNQNGVLYVLFNPAGGFGTTQLPLVNLNALVGQSPPRLEIHGIHNDDRVGEVQAAIGDVNGDGIADIAFGSPSYDDDNRGNVDAGFVGVIFGNRQLTGELGFVPEQVGTPNLPGVRFFGAQIGARAGASVASAGDFNRDGFDDFLIASSGERRIGPDGQERKGVAYLILGGPQLVQNGPSFNLSEVGSPRLPGIVFLSPYVAGTEDEAAVETVRGIGDIDGDGFDDVAFGLPRADFVFPNSPNQRRRDAGEVRMVYGSAISR